jgi:ABC-2 type transport system permease protein
MSGVLTFFRLELADALRSKWLVFVAAIYVVVFGAFLTIGLRESSMLGFTGLSRVVLNLSTAVVLVLPLVALVATATTIPRARVTGVFDVLLVQPVKRNAWLLALALSRLLVLLAPLAVLLAAIVVVGLRQGESTALVMEAARTLAIASALVAGYTGIGLALAAFASTPDKGVIYALVVWIMGAAFHDLALLGVLLRWRLPPMAVFSLAASNPMEAARIGILSGIDPDLSLLGPVGFWIANDLGATKAFLLGVSWPLVLGLVGFGIARARFLRSDLVG